MTRTPDISLIVTTHAEGLLFGATLRSLLESSNLAKRKGITTETIIYLDKAENETERFVLQICEELDLEVVKTDFGDQGKVRNHAAHQARSDYIAFLDGDDLWSENWVTKAFQLATQNNKFIVHPEINWFFGGNNNILFKVDQESEFFDPTFLSVGNPWDALCLAPRETLLETPYCNRDLEQGFAYEDWHWNCETFLKGHIHKVAKGTIHFKRRRKNSQHMKARQRKVLMPDSRILFYESGLDS